MSLEEEVRQVLNDFDNVSSAQVVSPLNKIKSHFRSELTRDYLEGKIQSITSSADESERKKICKNLLPYLDWYLRGI